MVKRKTTEEFVREATIKHGKKYVYTEVDYISNNSKVIIICPTHGVFTQSPVKHLSGQGCMKCGKESSRKLLVSNAKEFITKAISAHGDKYNYSEVDYINARYKVKIGCPKHGFFLQAPFMHLIGGCQKCGYESAASVKTSTTEDFVKKANEVHGDTYCYDKVEYTHNSTCVIISCSVHGDFLQSPNSHLNGGGCSGCSEYGFNPEKSAFLYILGCREITKIGITNRDVSVRLKELNKSSGESFSIIEVHAFDVGATAKYIETILLNNLRKKYKTVDSKFAGYSECFVSADRVELKNQLQELINEVHLS